MLAVMDGMESMATSMYQGMVQRLSVPELRGQVVQIGARTARHSAAVAIESTGRPNAYISPAVIGEEVVPNESGLIPLYAIPAQFGTLNAYQLIIGAPSSAGTRFTLPLDTPADNSYIYTGGPARPDIQAPLRRYLHRGAATQDQAKTTRYAPQLRADGSGTGWRRKLAIGWTCIPARGLVTTSGSDTTSKVFAPSQWSSSSSTTPRACCRAGSPASTSSS